MRKNAAKSLERSTEYLKIAPYFQTQAEGVASLEGSNLGLKSATGRRLLDSGQW